MNPTVFLQKGRIYETIIDDLGTRGEGIGKIDGFTVFVPGALPGEKIRWQAAEIKKNYAVGELREILLPSPNRIVPRCSRFPACGGCRLQHLAYDAELALKQKRVEETLRRVGKIDAPQILPVKGAADPWRYRNKMQFPVGRDQNKLLIGCYAAGSHRIIDTDECLIQKQGNNEIIAALRQVVRRCNLSVYDEKNCRGILRHVVGRVNEAGEIMLVLVTATENLPRRSEVITALRENLPRMIGLQQNIQPDKSNVIMGSKTKLLWGKATITEKLGNFVFNISPRSFFQVNTAQAKILYDTAREFAALTGRETLLDAYCGTGTVGLYLATAAKKVIGVEIVASAVEDARENARLNGIENAEFMAGDAAKLMPELLRSGLKPDVIVLDPPRSGSDETFLAAAAKMRPARIVYISCNPATLARDVAFLKNHGYEFGMAQAVDMFPQTMNIETVTLLTAV